MLLQVDDQEILEHGFSEDTLKSFLNIGYQLYKHQILKQIHTLANGNIESIIEARIKEKECELTEQMNIHIDELKNENIDLVSKIKEIEDSVERKYILEVERKELAIEHLKGMLENAKDTNMNLEKKLNELYDNVYSDSVQQLKDAIKQRDMEISCLKSSNMVKGQIGENMIIDSLRNIFTDVEVSHTGTKAHVCDVHMTFPNGKRIVFESKFKGNIEKRDVDKFYRDVEGLDKDVIGGVFVSLLSKNIPNKGSINFEITSETKRPIMYIAYSDENEFNIYFPHHTMMFTKLCEMYTESSSTLSINDIVDEVKFLLDIINKNKRKLDEFKGKFLKFYSDVDEDNGVLLKRIDNIIKRVPNQKVTSKRVFICSQCSFTCSTKKTLDNHCSKEHKM